MKELDEFLKQQAASLVAPTTLKESIQEPASADKVIEVSQQKILDDIITFVDQNETGFRSKFYEIIIQSIESLKDQTAEDRLLINTALYLKHGTNWKEAIIQYWKERQ